MNSELMTWLGGTTLATSAAVVLVALLRRPMRAAFGVGAAYALWALVPVALIAVSLPAPVRPVLLVPMAAKVGVMQAVGEASQESTLPWTLLLAIAWGMGGLAMAGLQFWQQRRFMRRLGPLRLHADGLRFAATSAGLPAVTGVLRPRIVLPADFLHRYGADERALVVAHERQHIARGDLACNALAALLRCVYWFNPLLHLAMARYRHDQELACDARVLQRHPGARRTYAQAMLKTQLDDFALPVGCHWHTHPIKERIAMLKRPSPRWWQTGVSSVLLMALFAGGGYAAWAGQPAAQATKAAPMRYAATLRLEVDGEQQAFDMRSDAGMPFAFALHTRAGHRWEGTASISPSAAGQVSVDIALKRNGVALPDPMMLVARLNEEASIKVSPDASSGPLVLTMRVGQTAPQHVRNATSTEKAGPSQRAQASTGPDDDASPFDYTQHAPPRYPKEAASAGITGTVVMLVDIAPDGQVARVVVEHSAHNAQLDAAAVEAARKWRFRPKLEAGQPVAHRVRVPIEFSIDEPTDGAPSASGDKRVVEQDTPFLTRQLQASAGSLGKKILTDIPADGSTAHVRLAAGRPPGKWDRAIMGAAC